MVMILNLFQEYQNYPLIIFLTLPRKHITENHGLGENIVTDLDLLDLIRDQTCGIGTYIHLKKKVKMLTTNYP